MSGANLKPLLIRELFIFSIWAFLCMVMSILIVVLPWPPIGFLLHFVEFMRNEKNAEVSDLVFYHVLYFVSGVMGLVIGCLMIEQGPTLENFITYAMGGSLVAEEEYGLAGENPKASLIRSPPNQEIPTTTNDVERVLVVNNNIRVGIAHLAFAVFQIFMYLMGCLVALHSVGRLCPQLSLVMVAISSTFWVSLFKLFAASHQYSLTMAKWVLIQSIIVDIVTLAYGAPPNSAYTYHLIFVLCVGAFPILAAVYCMRNPVNKLYTIYDAEDQISDVLNLEESQKKIGHTHEDDIEQGCVSC